MENSMQTPLQITFHGVDHSDAVEERVRGKVAKLEQLCDRITGCRVVIEAHHRNANVDTHKGEPVQIRIELAVPGAELIVKRDPKDPHVNEEIGTALKDAFSIMERQLKEWLERHRASA